MQLIPYRPPVIALCLYVVGAAIAIGIRALPVSARPSPEEFLNPGAVAPDYRWQIQQAVCLQNWEAAIQTASALLLTADLSALERSQLLRDRQQWIYHHRLQMRSALAEGCEQVLATPSLPPTESAVSNFSTTSNGFDWNREIQGLQSQIQQQNVTASAAPPVASITLPRRGNLLSGDRRQGSRRCQSRLSLCER
ncbi:hypothetical protein [Sphaerothrix gracilis]|uniref:hypothetical protein n=1 Tax=Sphaerothrix gracilis TaxID=3151835 RepID=UPI0031FCA94D